MPQTLYFSGKSLQQALLAAARHFHLEVEEVAYRQREQRQGLVRGRERVVVEVDADAPRRTVPPEPAASVARPVARPTDSPAVARDHESRGRNRGESRPRRTTSSDAPRMGPPVRPADLVRATGPESEAVGMALDHLARLASMPVVADVWAGPDGFWVDLREEGGAVSAERAEWLESVAHLLPRATRGLFGSPVAMRVDTGGARERLLEELRQSARAAADQVRQTGEPVVLGEMNPADRRIVHMTLAEDPDVTTESLGNGVIKRIRIVPR